MRIAHVARIVTALHHSARIPDDTSRVGIAVKEICLFLIVGADVAFGVKFYYILRIIGICEVYSRGICAFQQSSLAATRDTSRGARSYDRARGGALDNAARLTVYADNASDGAFAAYGSAERTAPYRSPVHADDTANLGTAAARRDHSHNIEVSDNGALFKISEQPLM